MADVVLSFNCLSPAQPLKGDATSQSHKGSLTARGEVYKYKVLFFKLWGTLFLANKDNVPVAVVHLLLHGTCQILTMSAIFFYHLTFSEPHCGSLRL